MTFSPENIIEAEGHNPNRHFVQESPIINESHLETKKTVTFLFVPVSLIADKTIETTTVVQSQLLNVIL